MAKIIPITGHYQHFLAEMKESFCGTTNVIERCFVEVGRRTRPMVCLVDVESVDRIIDSIFQRFNLEWKTRTLNLFTQAASRHRSRSIDGNCAPA